MTEIGTRVDLETDEGMLDVYTFQPPGEGPFPAVVLYMDAYGIRPELGEMAQRLASNGYFVVVPNLYHRTGPFSPFDPHAVTVEGPERVRFRAMIGSIDGPHVMRDTAVVLHFLDTQHVVRPGKIAAVGYCMGGGYALSAAGTFPDRVAAAASFHGGSLATDKPDSPHLLAGRMRARVYVGVASLDHAFSKEQQDRLAEAFDAHRVSYVVETYEGAKHGFAVTGHLAYDQGAAERHWEAVTALLHETLG